MNLFQSLLRKAAGIAARAFSFAPTWARYAFTQFSQRALITEGYKKNSAVAACATTLQLTFPEPPLLYGYEEDSRFIPDYNHQINLLLKQPNPDMGMKEFLQFVITYAPTGGNCYIWKQRSQSRKVVRLWPFSDLNIAPLAGRNMIEGFVRGYEFDAGDGNKVEIPKEDIIQWKWMIDPEYPYKGIGAIALSAKEVDRDSEAAAYIYALLKNNSVPPLVVNLPPGDDSTQDEIDALGKKWIQKHSRGEPAFVDAEMKVTQLGYDLNKLAGDSLADVPETRIAANFHVPPSVAGLNVGVKRSDYGDAAARKAFTEQTLMSLWNSLASEILNGLRDDFNLPVNAALQFDLRNVGALQEQKKDQWERVSLAFDRGGITRWDMKVMLGIVPNEHDRVYKTSLATEFVPENSGAVIRSDPAVAKSARGVKSLKAKRQSTAKALLNIRRKLAPKMTNAVNSFFATLAERIVERAEKIQAQPMEKKDLPNENDLLNEDDAEDLEKLIKRFYVEVARLSWDTWNETLGVDVAFDLKDPAVTSVLKLAGKHAEDIQGETLDALREALQYGSDNGWSIDHIIRGDATHPGLRNIVEETYANRARAVAISELGQAQNYASAERYASVGVGKVEILDGGAEDSAPACDLANGQIWTVELFQANLLQHPNCSRAAAPYFGDEDAEDAWPYEFGDRG